MRRISSCLLFASIFLAWPVIVSAQNYIVPAGTLLHCTLDEPNFSTATATVGDPIVCQLRSLNQFERNIFPRGAYLTGHLEAAKNPGHFVGKGYLKLEFDRICLPTDCLPVPGKLIAVRGYRVDRKGDVIGHGHAKRDTAEWLMPPLWPWKVLTLPARGPRPTLKGEVPLTLRVMDDIDVPNGTSAAARTPDRPPATYRPQSFGTMPASVESPQSFGRVSKNSLVYLPPSTPAMEQESSAPAGLQARRVASASASATDRKPLHLTAIAMKSSDTVFFVSEYRVENGRMYYTRPSGLTGSIDESEVDCTKTSHMNGNPATATTADNTQ